MKAEHRVGPLLLWGLALILAVALTGWFLEHFERRPKEVDAGLSAEARRNGFLAAERFLRRVGIDAQSLAGRELLRELPPTEDLLIVNGLGVLNEQRSENLHDWLMAGGRLLAAPAERWAVEEVESSDGWGWEEGSGEQSSDFLSRYGTRLHELEGTGRADRVAATASLEGYPDALALEFDARYALTDAEEAADRRIRAGGHDRLLQYAVGDGWLTVSSDMGVFGNARIGEHDHALFLALLAESPDEGKVWLLYDSEVPGIGTLLWRDAPYALIAFACLVAALLWHVGGRLGPLLPSPSADRRDLLVHLEALADFHWRHGRGSHLTRVTRERVEQAWLQRHPTLRGMEPAARADWVAQHVGVPAADVRSALYPVGDDDRDLLPRARLLQRLWAASGRGPRRS